jgi:hypothetical protein
MARKKKDDLQEVIDTFMTMTEASQWIEEHKQEFDLTTGLTTDTLKKACHEGRLKAALKGRNFLTREPELREYLKTFDPKNKRERRPLQARALKKRESKAVTEATSPEPVPEVVR